MTFDEYNNIDAINASFLKACLKSAYDGFKYLHEPKESTDAMDFGTAVHCAILEPEKFSSSVAVSPKFDRRTKQGKADAEAFDLAHAGKIIIDSDQMAKIEKIIKNCMAIDIVKEALDHFEKERSFTIESSGLRFKGRLDLYGNDSVIDVKTTRTASIREFTYQVIDLAYDVQLFHYAKITNAAHAYTIAIESDTCEVACFDLNDIVFSDFTKARYERALETAKYVLTLKECPAKFKPEIITLNLPEWAKKEEL